MRKPLYLDTDESLDGDLDVGGSGNDLYQLCESAYTGDLKTVQELINRDPKLVSCEYITTRWALPSPPARRKSPNSY